MTGRRTTFADSLRLFLAAGSALLVFTLGLMSVSPNLHDWAHQEHAHESEGPCHDSNNPPASDANHSCAIVAFAGGFTLLVSTVAPVALPSIQTSELALALHMLLPASPAHLLPPGRGPPLV
jgi:hypothetical protein